MNEINILWSFSSIAASISEIFAIKNGCFLALIFVERSEKLSQETACDVNVGPVKKSGKFKTEGAFHLVKISGISGSAVNGTRFVGSSHWKIPRKSGKSKKVGPFSRLEFPNGMSCSVYVSRSLYQFQVHRRAPRRNRGLRPNGTTFYQSEIPLHPHLPDFFNVYTLVVHR